MFKLFWKVIANMFLWAILLVNLFLFFNITTPVTAKVIPYSTHNYYFGVSSLIEAFKYIPNSTMGQIAEKFNTWLKSMSSLTTMVLEYGWVGFINSINTMNNATGQDQVIAIIKMIFALLRTGLTTIVSMILGLSLAFLAVAWAFFQILSIIEWLYLLTGGKFAVRVPHTAFESGMVNTPLLDFAVWGV